MRCSQSRYHVTLMIALSTTYDHPFSSRNFPALLYLALVFPLTVTMDDSTEPKSKANRRYIVSLMIRVSVMRYVCSAQWVTTRFGQVPGSTRRDVNTEVMDRCRRVTGCSVTRGRGARSNSNCFSIVCSRSEPEETTHIISNTTMFLNWFGHRVKSI